MWVSLITMFHINWYNLYIGDNQIIFHNFHIKQTKKNLLFLIGRLPGKFAAFNFAEPKTHSYGEKSTKKSILAFTMSAR